MKLTKKQKQVRSDYKLTTAKQLGNLHERMKYVMVLMQDDYNWLNDSLWKAIYDLELEVSYYKPENPPMGKRTN